MENKRLKETAIVPTTEATTAIPEPTARLVEKSFAENTMRNRKQALRAFSYWLNGREISDGLLAEYATYLFDQGKAPRTISIVVVAVKWLVKHRNGGRSVDLPITSATMAGIRREGRERGRGQRNGLTWHEVEKICSVQEADGTLRGVRNSAILRVMSDGLLRISEATELRISDLQDNTLQVRFSKTDQEGQGEHLYLCEDTRQILGKWLERSELSEGYLFRRMTARGDNLYRDKETGEPSKLTDDGVRRIIKSCAARVGLTDKVSGHSLRIGTTVFLAQSGASLVDIQVAGRWKDPGMPAHYARAQLSEREQSQDSRTVSSLVSSTNCVASGCSGRIRLCMPSPARCGAMLLTSRSSAAQVRVRRLLWFYVATKAVRLPWKSETKPTFSCVCVLNSALCCSLLLSSASRGVGFDWRVVVLSTG